MIRQLRHPLITFDEAAAAVDEPPSFRPFSGLPLRLGGQMPPIPTSWDPDPEPEVDGPVEPEVDGPVEVSDDDKAQKPEDDDDSEEDSGDDDDDDSEVDSEQARKQMDKLADSAEEEDSD